MDKDKFRKKRVFNAGDLISKESTITDLSTSEFPELGEFINDSEKSKLIIRATVEFKLDYSSYDKKNSPLSKHKPKLDLTINEIKKSPIPPETNDWKTLNEFLIKDLDSLRVATKKFSDISKRLVYIYTHYKQYINEIEYDIYHVILTNIGNSEVFNYYYGDSKIQNRLFYKSYNKRDINLELTLVETKSLLSKQGLLIERKRVLVENDEEAMLAIMAFIDSNYIYLFESTMSTTRDEDLEYKLGSRFSNPNSEKFKIPLTVDELYSLKYIFASTHLDLIITVVSDDEINDCDIPKNTIECNVVDNYNSPLSFVKFAKKFIITNKSSYLDLYSNIIKKYKLFDGDLFKEYHNPLKERVNILRQVQKVLGSNPTTITSSLTYILEYLGKDMYSIYPKRNNDKDEK